MNYTNIATVTAVLTIPLHALEVQPLVQQQDLFTLSPKEVHSKFASYNWNNHNTSQNQQLTLYGQSIHKVKLEQAVNKLTSLKIDLIDRSGKITANDLKAGFSKWGKLIQSKMPKKGKMMPSHEKNDIITTRYAWNTPNAVIVLAKKLEGSDPLALELQIYRSDLGLAYLKDRGTAKSIARNTAKKSSTPRSSRPRSTSSRGQQSRIRSEIKKILSRSAPRDVTRKEQAAVNLLNVYRYLCGVSYNVKSSVDLNGKAKQAATACKKHGGLSHGIGSYTEKSNLAMNTGHMTMASSVTQYIDDAGENNRVRRGHRRWCLNHKMGKAGFGIDGAYSAMYCFDTSGKSSSKNYSYPGHGQFPIKYLHGNAWSYYLVNGKAPADVKVEVYKLRKTVDKAPSMSSKPDGVRLPVNYVKTFAFSINFEPQPNPITKKGCYLVRINSKSLKKQYIVNLF